eukprot:11149515-Karenia_brevis.AAC.1
MQQFPEIGLATDDAAYIAGDMAPNLKRPGQPSQIVPFFHWLNSGIVCSSRTPASSKMKQNLDCVQKGEGETGQSW